MNEITSRPWKWKNDRYLVGSNDDEIDLPILSCHEDWIPSTADAEFIVRAVNSYSDMLTACKAVKLILDNGFIADKHTCSELIDTKIELIKMLNRVIVKAEF